MTKIIFCWILGSNSVLRNFLNVVHMPLFYKISINLGYLIAFYVTNLSYFSF